MSRTSDALSHHPAPHAEKLSSGMALFMLFAGPVAWFVQLCVGAGLTSGPCFLSGVRGLRPVPPWSHAAVLGVLGIATLIAIAATIASAAKLAEVKHEKSGGHAHLIEIGHGRTRFVALWGVILGSGSIVATLVTLVAFALVRPCVG